jgi:hypothetical protein
MSVFRANNAPVTDRSIPAPRQPHADEDDDYDGPTERLHRQRAEAETAPSPTDEPRTRPRRGPGFAAVLAVLALITATGAALLAWRALGAARVAEELAAPAAGPWPAGSTAATAGVGAAGAESYNAAYAREPLDVQVGCAAVMFLDLDEPRANVPQAAGDLRYDSRCGREPSRLALAAGARAGAQVPDSDIDAPGCARAIRTGPLGPGAAVPVRPGTVLCVLTAAIRPRMVLIEVTAAGPDGTAGMRATSWTIPG